MSTVVINDDPMIRAETLETVLGEEATVVTADLQTTDDIIEAAADAAALVVDVQTDVPAEVFEACENLQIVARAGVGVDGVDIPAAADLFNPSTTARVILMQNVVPLISTVGAYLVFRFVPVFGF